MIDVYRVDDFLEADILRLVKEAVVAAQGQAAPVYGEAAGATINARVRSAERLIVPEPIRELVAERLRSFVTTIEQRFATEPLIAEPPQFLRYRPGDFFVAHQDGNTSLVRDESRFRRVSVVVFLSSPDTYGDGALVLHEPYPDVAGRVTVEPAAGSIVAFRSETTHEVTPVSSGERYTIASWYRAVSASAAQ